MLDTHLMIWWQLAHPRLPAVLPDLVAQAESVYFSRASLWEMAIKSSLGRLDVDLVKFSAEVEHQGFKWLDIRHEHLLAVSQLPQREDHRDPFDRLLVAQSQVEPLILLTADGALGPYGSTVRVI
jgi:PIN domain nuclease of toxin-antitoxin system